jgi:hypothetical protein
MQWQTETIPTKPQLILFAKPLKAIQLFKISLVLTTLVNVKDSQAKMVLFMEQHAKTTESYQTNLVTAGCSQELINQLILFKKKTPYQLECTDGEFI